MGPTSPVSPRSPNSPKININYTSFSYLDNNNNNILITRINKNL